MKISKTNRWLIMMVLGWLMLDCCKSPGRSGSQENPSANGDSAVVALHQLSDTISSIRSDTGRDSALEYITDSSVNGVILDNRLSVVAKFGALDSLIDWNGCECAFVLNKAQSQQLVLHHANGGGKEDYDILTVSNYIPILDTITYLNTNEPFFATENNIHLGMEEAVLLRKFPKVKWDISIDKGKKIYSYHNQYMTYLATYTFVNSKLIEFSIGYDNS